ncbi:hypothetical protein LIER_24619 [Lithospermum erythrorhizon]|uniref:Uncharacterized protein n=1 Tax=Lithospermum erythrorhizon TaxID=34254 RepID=A0AAV3R525_LITER
MYVLRFYRIVWFRYEEYPYAPVVNKVIHQEPLTTQSASSSSDDSNTSSADSPLPQLTVTEKGASKIVPVYNDVMAPSSIKDIMSQSFENQADNFVLRPRVVEDQAEASVSSRISHIQTGGPLNHVSLTQQLKPANPTPPKTTAKGAIEEAARTEKAYQYEIANISASAEPKLVDFDDMLMDHPSLFTRVAIVPKAKPRKSMVPEATSTSPPPTVNVSIPTINPLLKRMATASPSVLPPSKKAKKAAPSKKILTSDSSYEELQVHEIPPTAEALAAPANVQVALEEKIRLSKAKAIRKDQEEASTSVPQLPKYTGLYLAKPYSVPNLEVTNESPWAVNGAFVLARWADHLALYNSSLRYKMEVMKKSVAFKNNLNLGLDKECKDQNPRLEEEAKRVEKLTRELAQERDLAKACQKAFEALAQAKRDAEMALASAAAQVETARFIFVNSTLRSFLSSPAYNKKVGCECATYIHSLVTSTQGRFPDLVSLSNEEVIRRPSWYPGLSLPKDAAMAEEGDEAHPPPNEEDHPINP